LVYWCIGKNVRYRKKIPILAHYFNFLDHSKELMSRGLKPTPAMLLKICVWSDIRHMLPKSHCARFPKEEKQGHISKVKLIY